MFPVWLHVLSIVALLSAATSALIVLVDIWRHPQHMAVMSVVWPVSCLFGSLLTLWFYFTYGRPKPGGAQKPFPAAVAVGALHCGSGCMIGDIAAEWLAFALPGIAILLGWHWLFPDKMYAVWVLDFIFAFLLGIVFQYFAIVPMRHLAPIEGIKAAAKADALSLTAWQVGMYGFMAFAQLYLFAHLLGHRAEVDTPEFWFAMQLAMLAGLATAYPVNWWLIRAGIKEEM